jgi:AAA domain, putative AbiEii toxin, Type IV TA system/AAA domain
MLTRLHLSAFTVFADADFTFGPGLNILVGSNATGKSHVLQAGYAVLAGAVDGHRSALADTAAMWAESVQAALRATFQQPLSALIRHGAEAASLDAEWAGAEHHEPAQLRVRFDATAMPAGPLTGYPGPAGLVGPVFISAEDVLPLSWLLVAGEQAHYPVPEPVLRLLLQLRAAACGEPEPAAASAANALTELLGGEVEEEGGRYYLATGGRGGRREVQSAGAGLSKLGTLQKLLRNGALSTRTTLFWDVPETSLNLALLRALAQVLAGLARAGMQIILATHSPFLLKQLYLLSRTTPLPVRYFSLTAQPAGATVVVAADQLELLPTVVALDEELYQGELLSQIASGRAGR